MGISTQPPAASSPGLPLLPALERVQVSMSIREGQSLLSETESKILSFVRLLVGHLKGTDVRFEIEEAIVESLKKYPTLLNLAQKPGSYAEAACLRMIAEFVISALVFSESAQQSEDSATSDDPVRAIVRTEELVVDTLVSSLSPTEGDEVLALKLASSTAQAPSQLSTPTGRTQPASPETLSSNKDFMHNVVKSKGTRSTVNGFGAATRNSALMWVLQFPRIFIASLDNIARSFKQTSRSSHAANIAMNVSLLLTFAVVLGGIGFYRMNHRPLPLAPLKPDELWSLPPEVVLPKKESLSPSSLEKLHGYGEKGKSIEVLVDGQLIGSASVAQDWSWTLTLPQRLPPGSHKIQIRYPESVILAEKEASQNVAHSTELIVNVQEPDLL